MPVVAHVVLFVERPAYTLSGSALNLSLNVAGMDGLAGVLKCCVSQNLDLAGFGIDFNVDNVGGECTSRTGWIHTRAAHYGAASIGQACGKFLERHPELGVRLVLEHTVNQINLVIRGFPQLRGAIYHLLLHVLRSLVAGPSCLERRAAAAGHGCPSDGIRIADLGVDVFDWNSKNLSELLRRRGTGAADVHRTDRK